MKIITPADIESLDLADIKAFAARQKWLRQARGGGRGGKQLPPADEDWEILLWLAGRGFGKTAAQIEWGWWEAWRVPNLIIHAVSPTLSDVRGTTFEGPAGFLATIPPECLKGGTRELAYNRSLHEIRLSNGSLIRGFGAVEEAGRLRGPQCHALLADELREWDRPAGNLETAMSNALLGLRLPYPDGTPSRAVMGTTPKRIPYLRKFESRVGVRVIRGTSYENLANLSRSFRGQIMSMAGTSLGRQEIDGAYIDEASDKSVIQRSWIKLWPFDPRTGRHKALPEMSFIVESYDTASSEHDFDKAKQQTDPTACVVFGVFNTHQAFTEQERKARGIRGKYNILLLKSWAERLGLPELLEKARVQHRVKYGPAGKEHRANVTLIEDKSSGPGVRQFLAKWSVPVVPIKPRASKLMRLHGISPIAAQGMIWVPESAKPDRAGHPIAWADEFLDEFCAYGGPGTTEHDDYVDAATQAISYLSERGFLLATPAEEFVDMEEKKEHEEREAVRVYGEEKIRNRVAPYG